MGTTMPVTMHAAGVVEGADVVIRGSHGHDGLYRIQRADPAHVFMTRAVVPEEMIVPIETINAATLNEEELQQLLEPEDSLVRLFPHHEEITRAQDMAEPEHDDRIDAVLTAFGNDRISREALLHELIHDMPDPDPRDERDDTDEFVDQLVREEVWDERASDFVSQPEHIAMQEEPDGMPRVTAGQVWLLPRPNAGLWRTDVNVNDAVTPVTLHHMRERDRVMNCTGEWLIRNGVRRDPPDPRTTRPGQQIVIGQVWEFNVTAEPRSRYIRIPRWRVHEISERAGRIQLRAADGSGKRIYIEPARLMVEATHIDDGLPRRTSFERVLEDDDGE